jgi:hypothetical protein
MSEYSQDIRGIVRFADQYPTIEELALTYLKESVLKEFLGRSRSEVLPNTAPE